MFGAIIFREVSDREPLPGETWYCQDWQCPAWMECEHHHGRSYEYAAMLEVRNGSPPLLRPDRPPHATTCQHFRRDKPRAWLKGWCEPYDGSWCCVGCEAPECPRAPSTVTPFRRPAIDGPAPPA